MTTRLESAYNGIKIAERWEREGDLRRAHMCYETTIRDFMHLSFSEYDNVEGVKTWLKDHPLDMVASRFIAITRVILQMPQSEWTRFFQSGNYLLIAFSHFFAALGQHDRARFFARTAAEPTLFVTPFWAEYAKTLSALMERRTYMAEFGRLKRFEQYWKYYVDLIQATMWHDDIGRAVAEIDRNFIIRNKDTSLHDDAYMIEGSGEFPLKFDFRKAGLLATIAELREHSRA